MLSSSAQYVISTEESALPIIPDPYLLEDRFRRYGLEGILGDEPGRSRRAPTRCEPGSASARRFPSGETEAAPRLRGPSPCSLSHGL